MRDEEVGMKEGCGSCDECMHGRSIICNHPVTRMAGILASRSPFFAALKSGPSAILFIALHADIVEQKCYARETCRFGNHTSMRLKNSALASHQNLLAIV